MSSSSSDAPFHFPQNVEWVDASQCQRCGTSSWLPWKHHCRACGGCFCQKCSSQVLALPPQHPTPVRVCDDCYAKYSSRSAARPVVRVEAGSGGHMSASLPVGFTARQLQEYDGSRTASFDPMSASLGGFGASDSPRATWLTNRPASYYSPVSPSPKPVDKEDEDEVEAIAEEEEKEKGAPQKEEKNAEESSEPGAQNEQQPVMPETQVDKSHEEGHRNQPEASIRDGEEDAQAPRRDETEPEAGSAAETGGSQIPENQGVEDVSRRDENEEDEPPINIPNEEHKEDDQPPQAIAEPTAPVDEEEKEQQGEPFVAPTREEIVPREQEGVAPDSGLRSSEPEGQETRAGAGDVSVQTQTTKTTQDASGVEGEAPSEPSEQQQPSADPDTPLPTARGPAEEEKAEVMALKESIKRTEEEDKVEKEKMEAIQNKLRNMQTGTIHARVEVATLAAKELVSSLFYGLRDALQLKRVTVSFKNSNRVYNRIWDTVILNGGLLLMMWLVFKYLLEPHFASALHFEEHRGITLGIVHVLQIVIKTLFIVLWVGPIYVLSIVLNIQWSQEIGNGAFSLYTYIRRGKAVQKASKSLPDTLAQAIYWQVIFGVFNVLNFFCKFVPVVGPPFYFLCMCWLNAVYCFDYKWGNQMWSLQKKISYCETRWLYFVGFGLPITLATFFFEYIISYSLVSLLFPLFIPMAMFGSPKTQSLWKPIPMSQFLDSSIIAPLIRFASNVPWLVQSLEEKAATIVRVLALTVLSVVTLGVSASLLFYLVF